MSDGQVTGSNDEILQSDLQKFKKISEKQFIAFAGDLNICEQIVDQTPYIFNFYDLENVAKQIYHIISEERFSNCCLFFALGGRDLQNEISVYAMEREKGLFLLKPKDDEDIQFSFLNPRKDVNLDLKLNEFLTETGSNTASDCLKAQKMLNDLVAELDVSVNMVTFDLTIEI